MRTLAILLGVIAVLAGLYFLFQAVTLPLRFNLATASAVQITQVYSEGTYNAAVAAAFFLFAGLCATSAAFRPVWVNRT